MPFTKVGPNKYRSPSGRTYDLAQVRLYYSGSQPGFRPQDEKSNPLISAYKRRLAAKKQK